MNRPHGSLSLDTVLGGIRDFAGEFVGELLTETMLVSGINDTQASVRAVATFLEEIAPRTAYLAVHPMRQQAVDQYLDEFGADRRVVDELIRADEVRRVDFRGNVFYVRTLKRIRRLQIERSDGNART